MYATAVTDADRHRRQARQGIGRVAPQATVWERHGMSLVAAYNDLLDEAARTPGVEALVLLHQDLELHDPDFEARLREALAHDDVALVGLHGRRGTDGLTEPGSEIVGHVRTGGPWEGPPTPAPPVDVDLADGMLLAFSPWAIRELRFDPRFEQTFHLYDRDICLQARAHGRRVQVITTDATHHFRRSALDAPEDFVEALVLLHRTWEPASATGAPAVVDDELVQLRRRVRRMDGSVTWNALTVVSDRTYRLLGGRDAPGGRALGATLRAVGGRLGLTR